MNAKPEHSGEFPWEVVDVRNCVVYSNPALDDFDRMCREQAQEGFALLRIVHRDTYQAVAVFEKRTRLTDREQPR